MYRRTSEYIRNRTSVVLVHEIRGVPFTVLSSFLSMIFLFLGIRFIFFCGQPITSHPLEVDFLSPFKNCKTDPWQEAWSGAMGAIFVMEAVIHFLLATTESVAPFYHVLLGKTFYNGLVVFLTVRAGVGRVPPFWLGLLILMVIYQLYVLYGARRVYNIRKRKEKGW